MQPCVPGLGNLYQDALGCIANYLDDWDLVAMSQLNRDWYRLIRKPQFSKRITYPFKKGYKLTLEQFQCLSNALRDQSKFKIVYGTVGSGKTWLATAYMMRKYGESLDCSLEKKPKMHALIIVPPTCVGQWSAFFRDYTSLPVLSNYDSSCFYLADWIDQVGNFGIIISSSLTSKRVQDALEGKPHIIIQDEAHNAVKASYDIALEVVGFTASMQTFKSRMERSPHFNIKWEVIELKSETLDSTLPPLEFKFYEPAGCTPLQAARAVYYLGSKVIGARNISNAMEELTYHAQVLLSDPFMTKKGTKRLKFREFEMRSWSDTQIEASCPILLSKMLGIPKLRQIVDVATQTVKRGEKLIIFDVDQSYILHLYVLLTNFGFDTYPFCTSYNPSGRGKLLEQFAAQGHVLIGSIEMLSEGHNITSANNIVFARYPTRVEEFMQAFGRCHRYHQKRTVYIHMITSCALELNLAMKAMETGYKQIRLKEFQEEINELHILASSLPKDLQNPNYIFHGIRKLEVLTEEELEDAANNNDFRLA